jgi:acyl transferase domain-containing protein
MYCQKLRDWLAAPQRRNQVSLAELMFTLADRANHAFPHKLVAAVTSMNELNNKLQEGEAGKGFITTLTNTPLILVLGGQESDFVGLSQDLYDTAVILRRHLDQCNDIALSLGYESLYPTVFQTTPAQDVVALHLGLFAVQYATAKAWLDCGLKATAVVGHSFGELTALCVSGTLSLRDAVKLIAGRAGLMQKYWGDESGS